MKKIICFLLIICTALSLFACSKKDGEENEKEGKTDFGEIETESDTPATAPVSEKQTEIPELEAGVNTLVITCEEGTADAYSFSGNTLTFSGIGEDSVYSLSGTLDGNVIVDVSEDYKFELVLLGVTLYSSSAVPIEAISCDEFTLTAKKDTENYIYDKRSADDATSTVVSDCDMKVSGKGSLTVISENGNGIHSKDDLKIKNLALSVDSTDNSLKGNDSVEIEGAQITLISRAGDAIKTKNSDISSKGNQRGNIEITDSHIDIYAACDGIDASYNVVINSGSIINVLTDKYSSYSEEVTAQSEDVYHIRFIANTYKYSIKYYNSDTDYVWANSVFDKSSGNSFQTYYYYSVEKITGYSKIKVYLYTSDQTQGQDSDYAACSEYLTWNTNYDTFAISQNGNYSWTNYATVTTSGGGSTGGPGGMGGGMGGPGGMSDGNTEKGDYSTKGIKADNEIIINDGEISVKSYDDAIHASSGVSLENGETSKGNVIVNGGTLSLYSNDDGIHADGITEINGGKISVTHSYEGLEGTQVTINAGDVSIVSSDDGINSTGTSGVGITFNGGSVYVYAGGDGVDSNSKTSYQGIVFNGSSVIIISTTSMNSSIDTEKGYTYTKGKVLALCPSNAMTSEVTNVQNYSSVATSKKSLSLSSGSTCKVTVGGDTVLSVKMPCQLTAFCVYLGSASAEIAKG